MELWYVLFLNLRRKIGQKRVFSSFWDEEAFRKIFRKCIFRYLKDTSAKPKNISKSLIFTEIRALKGEILLFEKVFVFFFIDFFQSDFFVFRCRKGFSNRKYTRRSKIEKFRLNKKEDDLRRKFCLLESVRVNSWLHEKMTGCVTVKYSRLHRTELNSL